MKKKEKIKVAIIIAVYKWKDALNLVLKSIEKQSILPNEIIIADDGSGNDIKELISSYKKKFRPKVIHVWQKNMGFRKPMCLNKAIAKSKSEYIITIDGDMILHSRFIEDHLNFRKPNTFVNGMRSKISPEATINMIENQDYTLKTFDKKLKSKRYSLRNFFLCKLFSGKKNFNKFYNFNGCNMAFYRKDYIHVNGYNEDIIGWGRDESEFASRLINNNIARRDLRFNAIAYHLHHEGASRSRLDINHSIFLSTLKNKVKRCKNGINQYI
ncbi:glycosyl transferase family 2 [Methylophilaceae bacterium]|nr:glycosyl transferase family 2 [Methylophilaceae bacterium]